MRVGPSSTRAFAASVLAIACGGETPRTGSPLERSIATAIGERLGVPVTARCVGLVGCIARLPDDERIPIVTWPGASGAWEWRVDGLLVTSDVLERYLRDVVGELGAAQDVRCAPKLRRIAPDERIECWLANGGKAFVTVRADGATSVEVELDKAAAEARSEVVTPAMEEEMARASRALDRAEETGEPPDAAVESAP